jgi:hypothetical protein
MEEKEMLLFVNICLHNIKDQIKRYFTNSFEKLVNDNIQL